MRISDEDWDAWKASPITEAFFKAFAIWEGEAKAAWIKTSWDMGQPDHVKLAAFKGRAEVLRQMQAISKEQIEDPSSEQSED